MDSFVKHTNTRRGTLSGLRKNALTLLHPLKAHKQLAVRAVTGRTGRTTLSLIFETLSAEARSRKHVELSEVTTNSSTNRAFFLYL